MNIDPAKNTFSKPMAVGVVTLLLGVMIGVTAEKFASRSHVHSPGRHTTNPASGSPHFATTNRLVSDPFMPDFSGDWDPFREMRNMQAEMDEMIQRSIGRFRMNPRMDIFKDEAGYSLSLDVCELEDRYEVRAPLPDTKAADAKVKLEGNRLEVEVTQRQMNNPQNTNSISNTGEWGHYIQVVELAGDLKNSQMKIDRKDHELVITIPKA